MADSIRELIERHHAYYEVLPYYVMIKSEYGSPGGTLNRIHSGFDIDIHGLRNVGEPDMPVDRPDYVAGYAEVKKIADKVSQRGTGCFIEVIPFLDSVFQEARQQFRSEAIIRIRISHLGSVHPSAGPPEQAALMEVEKELQGLGLVRR